MIFNHINHAQLFASEKSLSLWKNFQEKIQWENINLLNKFIKKKKKISRKQVGREKRLKRDIWWNNAVVYLNFNPFEALVSFKRIKKLFSRTAEKRMHQRGTRHSQPATLPYLYPRSWQGFIFYTLFWQRLKKKEKVICFKKKTEEGNKSEKY